MRRLKISILITFLILFTFTACSARKGHTAVIVAGSTSVQPYAEILSERCKEIDMNSHIEVQGGGSSAGITAVMNGAADIGMSSRALKENEQELWSIEIAKDGLVLIVHPNNLISNLQLEDIQRIYSGEITNWSEVGGQDAKIHVITREEGSGTRSAFEELVMKEISISPKTIVQDSNGTVRQLVSSDINAVGYISLGLLDNTIKALNINNVEATYENVVNNSYLLHRPFLFVCQGYPEGEVLSFIDFVMSDEGQNILKNEGLIPPME